ncbi:MAG: carboxypeptidase-like regulatory domain-containing protein, partial [Gramella sp.]|nr:carboxypeptidase-like regulatory domain-containing protein [Christiangramia sp.]
SEMVSPIAEYAFNYYQYQLEGTFFDDRGNLINKIEVTPRREKDRVFSGFIYIVEDLWQIYGVELTTTGQAIQVPPVENLVFRQNYKYSPENGLYIQISQSVDFSFKIFGFGGDGRFTAVYSDYNFSPDFDKKTFGREILSFKEEANKKDSLYWMKKRPVPLTGEEIADYVRKDSIQEVKSSKKYKDSVDAVRNRFGVTDILFGYSYRNSWKNRSFSLSAPIAGIGFNTVQGWNTDITLAYTQRTGKDQENYWRVFSDIDYALSEDRLRINGGFSKKFNNFNKALLKISGGTSSEQINSRKPITPLLNSITTIFFERNFMKLYEKSFAVVSYGQEIFPGINLSGELGWENRKALFNNTDHVFIDREDYTYTSNNPLQPDNPGSIPFEEHDLIKSNLSADITFAQKYMSYPNGRYNVYESKYPKLRLTWEKGFSGSESKYNYDHFKAQVRQNLKLGNKGEFQYLVNGGLLSEADEISLVDYQHFDANQTRIGFGSYVGKFNLMPYYNFSTNKNYAEIHAEHDFQGWILGKLALINKLNFNLIAGAHRLITADRDPYSEYSLGIDNLGFGKYRFLRLDYVVSDFGGERDGAFIFGLKF